MRIVILYALSCAIAGAASLWEPPERTHTFPGWPSELLGHKLVRLPELASERKFFANGGGRFARFADGDDVVIMRFSDEYVSTFHLSEPCFTGNGYRIRPLENQRFRDGSELRCFAADRQGQSYRVCEQIRDGAGSVFTEVHLWNLSRLLRRTQAPYWGLSIVRTTTPTSPRRL